MSTSATDPDPPLTLNAAAEKFRLFLASQGYPTTIRWLSPTDVLVEEKHRFWVRLRQSDRVVGSKERYAEGLSRKLGIELRAICATEVETFAFVFLPQDDLDRQCHLMGRMLKLSCPDRMRRASTIRNSIIWMAFRFLNKKRGDTQELFR